MNEELKPCPFCGSYDSYLDTFGGDAFTECGNCSARGPVVSMKDEDDADALERADKRWNQRVPAEGWGARR